MINNKKGISVNRFLIDAAYAPNEEELELLFSVSALKNILLSAFQI